MIISETLAQVLTITLLALSCLVGVAMTALRLPGTWFILILVVGYDWWHGWKELGGWLLALFAAAALIGEVIETLMSAWLAHRAGASKQAMFGAMIGGFLGMIFLSFLVPIPLVGSMIGALLGCFSGAAMMELIVRERAAQSARVGVVSAVGFALGSTVKTGIALLMSAGLIAAVIR